MEIRDLKKNWDRFGRQDPLWSILTRPDKAKGRWNLDEFFRLGVEEISAVKMYLDRMVGAFSRGLALDFGCGVGRLTQALSAHFDHCIGVDIAPSMIELANKYNLHGSRCEYVVNDAADLSIFDDDQFDFIYSNIVLQHMEPRYSKAYMREFVRILAPKGILLFQITTERSSARAEGSLGPLPDEGFRAAIRSVDSVLSAGPGEVFEIAVDVCNQSEVIWREGEAEDSAFKIQLGNHWLDEHGQVVQFDDGRSAIQADLEPGALESLLLLVTAPDLPGRYLLELDMVQEHVAWFDQMGSEKLSLAFTVEGGDSAVVGQGSPSEESVERTPVEREIEAPSSEVAAPAMEIYCVSQEEIESLLEDTGADLIDVEFSGIAGPSFRSARFLAIKRSAEGS